MGEAMMLQALERLQATLHAASTDLRNGPAGAAQISMEGILAFLEVLAVWRLLGDKGQFPNLQGRCDACICTSAGTILAAGGDGLAATLFNKTLHHSIAMNLT